MIKFKLAQKRNYFKFVLVGLPKPIDKTCLSDKEKSIWKEILRLRKVLLDEHSKTSQEKGLKVHNRCWCGKRKKTNCGDELCPK